MSDFLDALQQPHVQLYLRVVLGGLLVIAGVSKLTDRPAFREAVSEYQVLPASAEAFFAAALPWIEVAVGALLLAGLATHEVAALATLLFLSFAIAIAVNLARGRDFDCHCFGSVQRDPIGWSALIRSALLVVAALVVAVGASRFGALDSALYGSAGLPDISEIVPVVFLALVTLDVLVLLPEALSFLGTMSKARAPHGHQHAREGHAS